MSDKVITFFASDLDGTLLAPGSVITPATRDAVALILKQGACFCLASGRPAVSMSRVAKELFDQTEGLPNVCFNGALAVIMDNAGLPARTLLEKRLPSHAALRVLELSEELGYPVQWCDLTSTYNNATPSNKTLLESLEKIDGNISEPKDLKNMAKQGKEPLKLVMVVGDGHQEAVAARAREILNPDLCHVIAAEIHVEFLLQGCNKATALTAVINELEMEWEQVAFFGDNNNDVEALRSAGYAFAMPDGKEAAKQAAGGNTCRFDHSNDGVAVELMELLRGGKVGCTVKGKFKEVGSSRGS